MTGKIHIVHYSEATVILIRKKKKGVFSLIRVGLEASTVSIDLAVLCSEGDGCLLPLAPCLYSACLSFAVRLCSDRVSLIQECIRQSPTCYKQSTQLLGLAELLRVAGMFSVPDLEQGFCVVLVTILG